MTAIWLPQGAVLGHLQASAGETLNDAELKIRLKRLTKQEILVSLTNIGGTANRRDVEQSKAVLVDEFLTRWDHVKLREPTATWMDRLVPKPPAGRPPPPGTMPKAKPPPGTTPKAKGVPEVKAMPKSKAASKTTPKAKGASEVKAVKLATTPKASTWTAQRSLKRSLRLTSTSSYEPHDENSMDCT